jgi:hypothetical protein
LDKFIPKIRIPSFICKFWTIILNRNVFQFHIRTQLLV